MKQNICALLFFLSVAVCHAQIGLRLATSGDGKYMRYEPISLNLIIRNETVNTFQFGGPSGTSSDGRIYLRVQHESKWSKDSMKAGINLADGLVLSGGEQKELSGIILNSICNDGLSKDGVYTITAVLSHSRLGYNIESQPVKIEIHEGTLQKTIKMGLPSENPDAPIKSLDASLLLINEEPDRTWCLRVEDDKRVYAVKRLAPYIQGDLPQMIFDGYMIHILLQVRPKLYTYITYAMQGLTLSHPMQKYMVSSNGLPPMLDRSSGFVKLINAVPAIEGQDFLMEK